MKAAFAIFLLAASALGQQKVRYGQPVIGSSPACGPTETSFKVKLDKGKHVSAQPDPGKARVYFIHEAGLPFTNVVFAYPTSKFGMDGAWVGADHGNSWFSISVDPGEHHLCAALQSSFVDDRLELSHFTAEAGRVYFYRTRLVLSGSVELLELEPIDSDEGKYLVALYPLSVSTPKK
jgi:hypothetical protein